MNLHVLVVKVASLDVALAIVVGALKDGTAPFSDEPFGDALDGDFGPLAAGVEEDNLSDAAAQEGVLVDGKLGEGYEDVALDVECWQAAVVQGLEEVLDGLEEVGLGVEDGVLDGRPVQKSGHLWEELQLLDGGSALLACLVVVLAGLFHGDLEVGDLTVDLVFEVLVSVSKQLRQRGYAV